MKILLTGAAGFIGAAFARHLLCSFPDAELTLVDNMNNYYDPALKSRRLDEVASVEGGKWNFIRGDIADKSLVQGIFAAEEFDVVVNLAAQAGVRYSLENPDAYIRSNILGFFNILEACRHSRVIHLVFASSSSVYGDSDSVPYSTDQRTDSPVSLYAATKKSDELLAYSYSKMYGIPVTGLRFFTVYGPAGRPDMAYFSFTEKLLKGEKIQVFNYGECFRDFTYIDDIVEGLTRVVTAPAKRNYSLYNIGNGSPEKLTDFISVLKDELVMAGLLPADFKLEEHIELLPMQKGDVVRTFADTSALERDFGFKPSTPLKEGLHRFVEWYKDYINKK